MTRDEALKELAALRDRRKSFALMVANPSPDRMHAAYDASLLGDILAALAPEGAKLVDPPDDLVTLVRNWQEADIRSRDPVTHWAANKQAEREARNRLRGWSATGPQPTACGGAAAMPISGPERPGESVKYLPDGRGMREGVTAGETATQQATNAPATSTRAPWIPLAPEGATPAPDAKRQESHGPFVLSAKWRREAGEYPVATEERAHAAAVAVRLCADELDAALVGGCVSCGESHDGGYFTGEGEVGPFCKVCWDFLRAEFAEGAPAPAPEPRLYAHGFSPQVSVVQPAAGGITVYRAPDFDASRPSTVVVAENLTPAAAPAPAKGDER